MRNDGTGRRGNWFGLTVAASGSLGLTGWEWVVLFLDNTCCLVLLPGKFDNAEKATNVHNGIIL